MPSPNVVIHNKILKFKDDIVLNAALRHIWIQNESTIISTEICIPSSSLEKKNVIFDRELL